MPTSFAQVAGGGPRKFFVEERSRIFVVKYVDLPSDKTKVDNIEEHKQRSPTVNESAFLNLFYDGGDLQYIESAIQGYKPEGNGGFKVTFYKMTSEVEQFIKTISRDAAILTNSAGVRLSVRVFRPWVPTKVVTLRPIPLEFDLMDLKQVLIKCGWGTPVKLNRGLHKQIGNRRRLENEYVHVRYEVDDFHEDLLPTALDLEGHYVYVTKPGESMKIECKYCNGFWHNEDTCYKKKRDLEKVSCSFCGKSGHSDDQCVAKIVAEEEQQAAIKKAKENERIAALNATRQITASTPSNLTEDTQKGENSNSQSLDKSKAVEERLDSSSHTGLLEKAHTEPVLAEVILSAPEVTIPATENVLTSENTNNDNQLQSHSESDTSSGNESDAEVDKNISRWSESEDTEGRDDSKSGALPMDLDATKSKRKNKDRSPSPADTRDKGNKKKKKKK